MASKQAIAGTSSLTYHFSSDFATGPARTSGEWMRIVTDSANPDSGAVVVLVRETTATTTYIMSYSDVADLHAILAEYLSTVEDPS